MKRLSILALCGIFLAGFFLWRGHKVPPESSPPAPQEEVPAPFDASVTLRVLTQDGVRQIQLDEYLARVLLAEMPADFPQAALDAQAVAARTFALRQAAAQKHAFADICADPACCQGCREDADIPPQLVAAVQATDGLVMTYENALIDATFFSCSGGKTEAALAVWGSDVPYLQSVDSPGEETAPRYTEELFWDAETFAATLSDAHPEANLAGSPENWFGAVRYSEGGGVDTVFIGGAAVSGTELRRLFSLRSTKFTLEAVDGQVRVVTYGFGHRVGLSQYGAKAMADRGADFEAILTHYYTGAVVTQLQNAIS